MATLLGAKFKENHPDSRRSFVANHDNFQESAPLINDNSNFSRLDSTGSIQNIQPWNVFMETVDDEGDDTDTSKVIEIATKVFKAVVYIITFCMVLGGAVVSKGALLFLTSIIRRNRNFEICKTDLGLEKDKNYIVQMSDPERYAWIWCLLFALFIPEILSFLRSCRICIFKSCKRSKLKSFFMVFVMESLHVSGLVTLVFLVLPELDSVEAVMLTNAVCLVPGILNLLSRNTEENHFVVKLVIDIAAICSQGSVFILWHLHSNNGLWKSVLMPFSVILVSFGWWENFVDKKAPLLSWFVDIKNDLRRSRYFVYAIVSVWKLLLTFSLALLCLFGKGENVEDLFTYFSESFSDHPVTVYWQNIQQTDIPERVKPDSMKTLLSITSDSLVPILIAVTHAVASLLCYIVGKFACKVCIQGFSYALPVSLTIPVALSFLISGCREHVNDPCLFSWFSPYLFWQCPKEDFLSYFSQHYGVWILWIVSQTWIAIHIWTPKCERLASTEKLFVNPMYSGVLIDQSLALNRRKEEEENIKVEDLRLDAHRQSAEMQHFYVTPQGETAQQDNQEIIRDNNVIPRNITRIYVCATMWHETPEEMVQLLKSVMRMDEDQSARRNAQIYLDVMDPDFYLFEAHIFFDDAFVVSDEDDDEFVVNNFVKDFVAVINEAASKVHQTLIRLKPPTKIPTPYGGRLVWSLPGGNLLIVHLKNKELIRHKKRWSQVMYMYYLLGHRLMELDIETDEKAVLAENTYILALDGDINFQPHAVQLLVDLMKKNRRLGAACGRIHPVGTGAMVYYQKFEYAIGHWLQKATEHMIGCVLCSPGCFSLFRAKALMDDNVMRTYTAKSREAAHYIQYDQGEDRWLCTLLLQRGYRVEYSAASDAYTHCPETFGEFYTQRRRWAPSTMANIMDLLIHYKRTVGCNENISMPYIAYQVLMMAGTILGPGTIFLMLVGAMVSAFNISSWNSLIANLIPVAFFIIICFLAKNDTQILTAQIFSAGYALLMMAVLVGIALQLVQDGITSPSAIFLLSLTASFLIAALVHPQEFWCVAHGLLYFLSVPSMYLLLFLYSIVNLNVVSWGTREVQTKKSKKQLAEEELHRKEEVVKQKKNTGMFSWLSGLGDRDGAEEEEGSITFGLANLFRCMCCTYPKPNEEKMQLMKIHEQLQRLTDTINGLQKHIDKSSSKMSAFRRRSSIGRSLKNQDTMDILAEENEDDEVAEYDSEVEDQYSEDVDQGHTYNQPDSSPYWITDDDLKNGNIEYLTEKETVFWKEMIAAYLYPLVDNPDEKAKIAAQLKELRNKAVFVLLMANSLFILIVFLLQANKEDLHIDWPLNVKANITFIPATNEVVIDATPLQLEPINLVLAFFFTLILIIQFVGMLQHRLETMSHILASTELKICSKNMEDMSGEAFINKHAVKLAKILQQLRDDERTEKQVTNDKVDRRPTIHVLEKRRMAKSKMKTLDFAFRKRYDSISADSVDKDVPVLRELRKLSMSRDTLAALQKRRDTIVSRASIRNSIYPDTPRMTRSDILEMRRLNEHFSTPNGSVRSGIRNSAYETDSDEEAGMVRLRATLHGEMNLPSGSELPTIRFKDEDTVSAVSRGSLRRKLSSINED